MSQHPCHQHDGKQWFVSFGSPDVQLLPKPPGWRVCPTCHTLLRDDGTETRMVSAVTPEVVRATEFFATVADQMAHQPTGLDKWEYRQSSIGGSEIPLVYAALSQSTGLAAAEWLALKYGRFVYLERLGFPDEYDAEACERAASEIAKEEMDAALAAVGAEPGPSDKPEEADHARD